MADLKIVVTGASGRMGRTLIREIAQGSGITPMRRAGDGEGHPNLGLDSGTLAGMQANGIKPAADPLTLLAQAQVVVISPPRWSRSCWPTWRPRRASSM